MAEERRSRDVSLGCGTLILIALIVLIFSGRNSDKLEHAIQGLQSEVSELRNSVEAQTVEIRLLEQKLDEQK